MDLVTPEPVNEPSSAEGAMRADRLKLERDGWLWYGRKRERRGLEPLYRFIRRLPNGNVLTTDGGEGALEWGPRP